MKEINTIAILGAGAMGAAYAAMFTDAGGFDVCFVARGERYEKLRRHPLDINGKAYEIDVVHPDRAEAPADLVIVALKHHHLEGGMDDLTGLVGDHTVILSVMNGLESEEMIGAVFGMDKLVYAIALGIDAVHENGRFTYANPGRIIFGATDHAESRQRVPVLRHALERAAIPCEVPDDIRRSLWWKFMINVGMNQASAVLGAGYGVFQTSADARALMRSLMEEVITLARKEGIDLTEKDIEAWGEVLNGLSPGGKTSMLQDVEAERKTEVEIFAGKVVDLGRRHRIATPVNETVFHIIRVLEKKAITADR